MKTICRYIGKGASRKEKEIPGVFCFCGLHGSSGMRIWILHEVFKMNEVKGSTKSERQQGGCADVFSYRSKPAEEKVLDSPEKKGTAAGRASTENKDVSVTFSKEGEEKAKILKANKQEQEESKRKKQEEEEKTEWEDRMEQLKAEKRAIRNAFQRSSKNVSYDATRDMSALAGASKIGQVKALKSRLRLTAANIMRSGADETQIKLAVVKIKKVLKKVEQKQKRLQEEDLIQKRQKKAEEEKQEKLARKIKRELEKRKKLRKAEEYQDVMDSAKGRGVNADDVSALRGLETVSVPQPPVLEPALALPEAEAAEAAVPAAAEVGSGIDISI